MLNCLYTKLEKYEEIVKIMDSVIMNPPPDCKPIKSTSREKVYRTLYEIQKVIGKRRFVGESVTESEDKTPINMVAIGYSSHDCESWYACPLCRTQYGSWEFFHKHLKGGDVFKCSCGQKLYVPE